MTTLFAPTRTRPALSIVPRDYQTEDLEESFRLWDSGTAGTLTRAFTGAGKTPMACMCFDRWLDRGPNYRCIVLSYEQQLVWQFAEEIESFLGITPGIEMAGERLSPHRLPQVIVASRQSLAQHELATQEQRDLLLTKWGITDKDLGLATMRCAKSLIVALRKGLDPDEARRGLQEFNAKPECDHETQAYSRLHKFDWKLNWLVVWDEAHKYSLAHATSGPIYQWFSRNPDSRHKGLTATPKRFDGKSLGTMFPGVSLDFPLAGCSPRTALREGYAVPYLQQYIEVADVDFASLRKLRSETGFDEARVEALLLEEKTLTALCDPLLDLVGNRRTLIFNPGVEMAKAVAEYINVRAECECPCGRRAWYPKTLIGDGAKCKECGELLSPEAITRSGEQARALWGEIPHIARKDTYRAHKSGTFQFLSVCGLCKEGFNDPEISCVAVFRPISKKASALAEQMKGRASRPLRGLIEGMKTAEERLSAIAASSKPDALIVDMTGITELPDCASTVQLYAEGLPDDVIERAEKYQRCGGVPNVMEAIEKAQRDIAAEREAARLAREEEERQRREEARQRSQAGGFAKYSTHDVGHGNSYYGRDPHACTEKQESYLQFLGMRFVGWLPSKRQAMRMIGQLKDEHLPPSEVAYLNRIKDTEWELSSASLKQVRKLARLGINAQGMTPVQASDAIERVLRGVTPKSDADKLYHELEAVEGRGQLDAFREKLRTVWVTLSAEDRRRIGDLGVRKSQEVF